MKTMNKYSSPGFRSVEAESMNEAAATFALRAARREFGRNARVGTLRKDSYAQDGSFAEYESFIGSKSGQHEISGRNIRFTVYLE